MKRINYLILLFISFAFAAIAQNPLDQAKAAASKATGDLSGIGAALSQLQGGLNPESLSKSFNADSWLSKVSALSPTDISGATSLLGKLGKGINPSSLISGFNVKDWSGKLKSVASIADVASQAESLIKGISPSAFKNGFDVGKLTSSLDMLKAIK